MNVHLLLRQLLQWQTLTLNVAPTLTLYNHNHNPNLNSYPTPNQTPNHYSQFNSMLREMSSQEQLSRSICRITSKISGLTWSGKVSLGSYSIPVKSDPEFDQLSADLTNNWSDWPALGYIFCGKLTRNEYNPNDVFRVNILRAIVSCKKKKGKKKEVFSSNSKW